MEADEDVEGALRDCRLGPPSQGEASRCGECGRRCPATTGASGRRRWRALDLGSVRAFLEADSPRVRCTEHGVVVAQVPWARHGAGHTYAFDDTCCVAGDPLLEVGGASSCCASPGARWARSSPGWWPTPRPPPTASPTCAASASTRFRYKRGHKYLTVVVDHDSGVLLWAHPGRDQKTLEKFFDRLGDERCAAISLVSADAAEWIANVVGARCKNAELCLDPFHIVAWATKALDEVRREVWNAARRQGQHAVARDLKNARYALWKNPGDLTARQEAKLASIAQTNQMLYRAYLLKEQLRQVFRSQGRRGHRPARRLAEVGPAVSHPRLREAGGASPSTVPASRPPSPTACPTPGWRA